MLILAFDTATDVATSALVADGEVLGERSSVAATLLEDLVRACGPEEMTVDLTQRVRGGLQIRTVARYPDRRG